MGRYERFDPGVRSKARRAYRRLTDDLDRYRSHRGKRSAHALPFRRRAFPFGLVVGIAACLTFGIVFAAPDIARLTAPAADGAVPQRAVWTGRFGICRGPIRRNCVVDGDTFWIGGEKVRIAGIDTPELSPPRCAEEERRGEAAKRRLHALLNGGEVALHRSGVRDRDRYGRLLRDASVDGRDVGAVLIAEGLARPYGGGRRPWC